MNVFRSLYLMAGSALALSAILSAIGWPFGRLGYVFICAAGSIAWFGLDWYEREEMKAMNKHAGTHRAIRKEYKHTDPFLGHEGEDIHP